MSIGEGARMRTWTLALSLLVASCSTSGLPSHQPMAGLDDPHAIVVHEWGTFTSMVGATGQSLEGLHHEEEALPPFVHARAPADVGFKGIEGPPTGVTQKLETPVLYFYTQTAQPVQVHVDFPQGIISQWFPGAVGFQPALGAFMHVAGGAIDWQAQLTPGLGGFPAVAPTDIWAPSRNVASVPLQVGGENEHFIFYRGLGAFSVPFGATVQADGSITIKNDSPDPIQDVFMLRLFPSGGVISELGGLDAHQQRGNIVPPAASSATTSVDQYVADASARVAAALVKSGLAKDEARAMVDTWSRSYFRSQGLRLLYIVPRAWTDQLLPLAITPKPAALVRTLVGRVELLTPGDEHDLLTTVQAAATSKMDASTLATQLGRFAEPKLRRAAQLTSDAGLQSYLSNMIAQVQMQP
jgi:hypothetical protein